MDAFALITERHQTQGLLALALALAQRDPRVPHMRTLSQHFRLDPDGVALGMSDKEDARAAHRIEEGLMDKAQIEPQEPTRFHLRQRAFPEGLVVGFAVLLVP